MIERQIEFYSEGYKLCGSLYFPDDYQMGTGRRPAVLANSGYRGFNKFYPRLFARYLTALGYICMGFDYRGFGHSEGVPGRVILDEQVQDIINAVTFLTTVEEVDRDRISILGWGMGASNVIRVTAEDSRVRSVIALNGFYDGERWLRSVHPYVHWRRLISEIEEDRIRRVTTGQSLMVDGFHHYPLDPITDEHVHVELANIPGYGDPVSLQFSESLVRMNAEVVVHKIAPRPIFIGHGKDNLLHPIEEATSLYNHACEPRRLYLIDGHHNDFMYFDHPQFQALMNEVHQFLTQHGLGPDPEC